MNVSKTHLIQEAIYMTTRSALNETILFARRSRCMKTQAFKSSHDSSRCSSRCSSVKMMTSQPGPRKLLAAASRTTVASLLVSQKLMCW